jgi:hypothetical protein
VYNADHSPLFSAEVKSAFMICTGTTLAVPKRLNKAGSVYHVTLRHIHETTVAVEVQ